MHVQHGPDSPPQAGPAATLTFADIEQARERIRDAVPASPLRSSVVFSQRLGCKVYLKLENLLLTGSFKERGACNRMRMATAEEKRRGFIASSAGNHAQALAYHATRLGLSAKIVMPEGTPLVKVTRTRSFGGEVVLHGANYDEAYAHALQLGEAEDRTFIHPFNDLGVMAGQGTLGLELLEQNPYIDTVLVPIGGGGLAAGVAVAIKETNPKIRVIGVQAELVPGMKAALEAGGPVQLPPAITLCDGIAVRRVGDLTFATVQRYIDDVITVSEAEVATAILELLEQEKTVAEGSGATGVAALLANKVSGIEGKRVCAVVSGGNIDVNVIARIIERGLVAAGRMIRLDVAIADSPGSLAAVLAIIAQSRANVLEVHHNRTFVASASLGMTHVELKLEMRGEDHIAQLRRTLEEHGIRIIDHL